MALQLGVASNFPSGFNNVTIRGVPITQSHPGQVFWVSNSAQPSITGQLTGSDGNPGTFNAPFASLQYAISRTAPMRGDIIFIKPGHNEYVTTATLNVPGATAVSTSTTQYSNGVAVVGLGTGAMRPTFTFGAAAAAFVMGSTPATVTASVSTAGVMTVTVLTSGTILTGMQVFGTSILPGTYVEQQLSGATVGGVGTYQLSVNPPSAVGSGTLVCANGCDCSFSNLLFVANFADVASVFKMTAAGYVRNLTIERCEFKDQSSVLNFMSIVTAAGTTANNMDGLAFNQNKIASLGTTAATTAIKFTTAQDNVQINDNFGNWAVLDNTAAMLATGANSVTNFEFGRNRLNKPNVNSTTGSFISTSATAWTGHAYDNYLWQLDNSAGIWIDTGTKLAFSQNFSPITGAADKSGLVNPAAV